MSKAAGTYGEAIQYLTLSSVQTINTEKCLPLVLILIIIIIMQISVLGTVGAF